MRDVFYDNEQWNEISTLWEDFEDNFCTISEPKSEKYRDAVNQRKEMDKNRNRHDLSKINTKIFKTKRSASKIEKRYGTQVEKQILRIFNQE